MNESSLDNICHIVLKRDKTKRKGLSIQFQSYERFDIVTRIYYFQTPDSLEVTDRKY